MRIRFKSLVFSLLAFAACTPSFAEMAVVQSGVYKVMVTDGKYGNCMAALKENPKFTLPSCGNTWVTFSCSGEYTSKDVAYRMFDLAQMAFALDKEIKVYLDDTKQHDGYCYADRIDAASSF